MKKLMVLLGCVLGFGCVGPKGWIFYSHHYNRNHGKLFVNGSPPTGGVVSAGSKDEGPKISPFYEWDYYYYHYDRIIMVSAVPFSGWRFVCWDDGDTNAIREVVIHREETYMVASFELEPRHPQHPEHPHNPGGD